MRILLLLLVSCGSVEIPLFEQHLGDDEQDSKPTQTRITMAVVANCNMQAFNNQCTFSYIGDRLLYDNELYNNYCLTNYQQCTRR